MRFSFVFISLLFALSIHAQHAVKGVVTDIHSKPLEGVNVIINGTVLGTATSKDGSFELQKVPTGEQSIRLSYSGYSTISEDIYVNENMQLSFTMDISPVDLNAFVVTASRSEQQKTDAPVIVQTIKGSQIQDRGIGYLPELLNSVDASFEMQKSNTVNSYQLSGLGPQYTVFLINGERMSGETKGANDLSRINPSSIERVEIVKGASSTLYGSNAIGGVVNIITKEIPRDFELSAGTQYSFYDDPATNELRNDNFSYVNLGLKKNNLSSITNFKLNNYDQYDLRDGQGVNGLLSQETEQNMALNQRFTYVFNSKLKVNAYGSFYQLDRDFSLNGYADKLSQDYTYGLRSVYNPTNQLRIELSYNSDNNQIYDVYGSTDSLDYDNQVNTLRLLSNFAVNENLNLVFGSEYLNEKQSSAQNQIKNRDLNDVVLFTQGEYNLFNSLFLTAGLRADIHDIFGVNLTPQINALYKFDVFQFRAGYGMGYRTPTAKELYTKDFQIPSAGMPFALVLEGNSELKPEQSQFLNGSISYQRRNVSFSLSASINYIDNLITSTDSVIKVDMNFMTMPPMPSKLTYQYHNIDEAMISSLDANFSWSIIDNVSFSASYVYTDGNNITKDETLTDIRKHQARVNLDIMVPFDDFKLGVNLFGGYYGEKKVRDIYSQGRPLKTLSDYQMFNLTSTLSFKNKLTLTAGIKNILNTVDEDPLYFNYATPGQTFVVGLRLAL